VTQGGQCAPGTASGVSVEVLSRDGLRSGEPFEVAWSSSSPSCKAPHYLVMTVPERVRFSGDGAIALGPNERAPYDISHAADAMRLAIPLHERPDGAIAVIPFVAGSISLEWAIVIPAAQDASVLPGESLHLALEAGTPKIVVQDLYSSEWPLETLTSPSGMFRLDIFDGHFRVFDTLTGALVLAAEGYRPGFSPSSRFLHVFGDKASQFRVFDLYSESLVLDLDRAGAGSRGFFVQGLEWSAGDTFLMVAYEAAGAVGFKEMLFDRPFRYRSDRCGACSPTEAPVALDIENALVTLDGAVYSLLADDEVTSPDRWTASPLRHFLEPDRPASAPPTRYVARPGEPDWFLNGPRTASVDHNDGVPIFLSQADPAMEQETAPNHADGTARRGAVSLSRAELTNRDTRIAERLAAFGIELRAPPPLAFDSLTFLHVLDDRPEKDTENNAYRIEPGRAALARRLASQDTAAAVDRRVAGMTIDNPTCGVESSHRAFDASARLWSWRLGERLFQVVQYYCYVSTGSIPAGIAFLVEAENGNADYAILGETIDGELALEGYGDYEPWTPEDKEPSLTDIHMHDPLKLFRPGDDLIALLNGQGSLAVYHTSRRQMLFSIEEIAEFASVATIAMTVDGRHIVQINDNGRFFLYETETGAPALAGRYLDDEVAVYGDDLRFDATPEGASHVHLKFPGDRNLYQLAQFEQTLRTQSMAASRLSGDQNVIEAAVISPPPAISLVPAQPRQTASAVRIDASSAAGLQEINIYRDGRVVETIPVHGQNVSIERELKLHSETRWLAARATDLSGTQSAAAILPVAAAQSTDDPPSGRLFVVSVGTDTYDDPRIADLRYAASDARAFVNSLARSQSAYYRDVRAELFEDVPHLSGVLPARIEQIASQMQEADTLFVHVAGHGLLGGDGGLYLADRATRADDLPGTAMAWAQLSNALSSVPGRVFIFLDACHSGAAGSATNDQAVDSLLASASTPVNVIAASKGRQFSLEGSRFDGGAFTSALTAIFSDAAVHDANGNGVLEFSELYRALKQRVVSETDGAQIPWVSRSDLVGDAPVL